MCYLYRFESVVYCCCPLSINKGSIQHNNNLEKNLLDFDYGSGALPDCLSLACMGDSCGIRKTCLVNRAKYHKKCIILYNHKKLRWTHGKTKCKIEAGDHRPSPTLVPVLVVTSLYVEGTMQHKASSDTLDNNSSTWSKKADRWGIYTKLQINMLVMCCITV